LGCSAKRIFGTIILIGTEVLYDVAEQIAAVIDQIADLGGLPQELLDAIRDWIAGGGGDEKSDVGEKTEDDNGEFACEHSWSTNNEATCTTAGIRICVNEGCEETETIPSIGHQHEQISSQDECIIIERCVLCEHEREGEPNHHFNANNVCIRGTHCGAVRGNEGGLHWMFRGEDMPLRVESAFGYRWLPGRGHDEHMGVDITRGRDEFGVLRTTAGAEIYSMGSGKVISIGHSVNLHTERGRGHWVIIELDYQFRGQNLRILFQHMAVVDVEVGWEVDVGTKIGEVGDSGSPDSYHLHFDAMINGQEKPVEKEDGYDGNVTNPLRFFTGIEFDSWVVHNPVHPPETNRYTQRRNRCSETGAITFVDS
jgi:murein DD-endopeptidase MepM/ murein hydrolase activator NlpD